MEKFYSVIRIFFKGETETHSVQQFSDLQSAQTRYFNMLASDLGNEEITYCSAYIIDSNGMMVEGRVFDKTVTENTTTVESEV